MTVVDRDFKLDHDLKQCDHSDCKPFVLEDFDRTIHLKAGQTLNIGGKYCDVHEVIDDSLFSCFYRAFQSAKEYFRSFV